MLTVKRLDKAYKNAKEIPFDNNSKYIFFSDVHRGDNTASDEFSRNQSIFYHALDHYYENEFTYIEIGDGDELWEHAKFKYIRGAHREVYNLLGKFHNAERLVMLYGNHNIFLKNPRFVEKNLDHFYDEYLQEKINLFPGIKVHESVLLKHTKTSQEIFVCHGHQGDLINDQLWRFSMVSLRYFWRYMHTIGFRNPASPAKNVYKQHRIERNFNKWNKDKQKMMICGHTHRLKFPNEDELPYFNTGCCVHPRGITGIEIENGEISLVEWSVATDKEGALKIIRKVLRGPSPILIYEKKE